MRFLPALLLVLATASACKKADDKPKADPAAAPAAPAAPAPAPAPTAPAPGGTAPAATAPGAVDPSARVGAQVLGPDTLRLRSMPNVVGDKRTKIDDIVVIFQVEANGQKIDVHSTEHKEEAVEVLAVDAAGTRTKQKVTYTGMKSTQTVGGKSKDKPQVLDGKSYVVWIEGGEVKATTADGAAVSADELAELVKANRELGRPEEMDSILADRVWKIGETYTFTADDLAKLNARSTGGDRPIATAMSLTLERFDDKQAVMRMTTELRQEKGKDKLDFAMQGPVTLELPQARAISMEMEGTIKGVANGMPSGGSMKNRTTYRY